MGRSPSIISLFTLALALTARGAHELPPPPPYTSHHPTFMSTVLSVTDGDTLTVLVNGTRGKVRLSGIDCPESDQPFGSQATQLTTQLAMEKAVTVTDLGRDKYHRLLGEVVLPDGRMLNRELVREGFCWWYRKYASGNRELERLETEAREARRGLWADPNPMPPWEWRHPIKEKHEEHPN
jgi:endonuclease YncB( thermonuclease family)